MIPLGIIEGDALAELQKLETDSVDLIATDPPYGYSFMGKDWDRAVPSVAVWGECLRILKPGGFAFVMCAPRQDCLGKTVSSLSDAGFEMGFSSIYWAYGSGFPKAQNIGVTIDKRECQRQLEAKLGRKATKDEMEKAWKQFRRVVGTKLGQPGYSLAAELNPGGYSGMRYDPERECSVTTPATPEAQALDGSYAGFQPKPALEVILVCMKPLSEKSYVKQALKDGKGVTWLDEGKIPCEKPHHDEAGRPSASSSFIGKQSAWFSDKRGRFPANLLVSDDVLDDGRERSSGLLQKEYLSDTTQHTYGKWNHRSGAVIGDSGSFSRYFDLDRWWTERVKLLPQSVQQTFPFLIVSKPTKAEKNRGCEELPEQRSRKWRDDTGMKYTGSGNPRTEKDKNFHPTVKPLKLMSYLITLGSREKDLVLDPFVGSGTTCVAAQMLGRRCVGIDNDPEMCEVARARLSSVKQALLL